VLVRTDLTLPQQFCQAIHAAYEAGLHLTEPTNDIHYTVVCQVPNEEALLKAQHDIERKGIRTIAFQEPDLGNQTTALATEPIVADDRRKLAKYKLWEEVTCLA
jgi:hypothetical protein